MYGGVGFNGVYQETDFIIVYKKNRLNFHLEYYYNFTSGITDIPEPSGLFDFDTKTTRGLLDFIVNVTFDKKNHWNLTSSTFLFGRDTDFEQEIIGADTTMIRNDQRYSQYFGLTYTWYLNASKVEALVGGVFSWANPSGDNFYGSSPGINEIGIAYSKSILINDKVTLPVKASAYINPLNESTYLILTINLIQLSKL